jgi:glycosyltransferase involved in cell wall biosynthesis
MRPKFSIITSAWNRRNTLPQLFKSLNSQAYKSFEWVIADDGSVDGTLSYLKTLKKQAGFQLKIISSNVRQGKTVMDNLAIEHSCGEYLLWCDSDDTLEEGALQTIIDALSSLENGSGLVGILGFTNYTFPLGESEHVCVNGSAVHLTFHDLYTKKPYVGDMLLCVNRGFFGGRRFPEVDFVYPEGGLWSTFGDAEFLVLPKILKKISYVSKNRISYSGRMEYNRGRAYALAHTYSNLGFSTLPSSRRFTLLVLFVRYGIHGELKLYKLWDMWTDRLFKKLFFLALLLGFIFAIKDRMQGKVVSTHLEFERSRKSGVCHTIF